MTDAEKIAKYEEYFRKMIAEHQKQMRQDAQDEEVIRIVRNHRRECDSKGALRVVVSA